MRSIEDLFRNHRIAVWQGKVCDGSVNAQLLQKAVRAGLFQPDADKFINGGLIRPFAQAHARFAWRPGALSVVAGPAAGHAVVEIRLAATGDRCDMVDGQRLLPVTAIDAGMAVANQDIPFGERYAIAVNTADNLDQHHDGRCTENLSDASNHPV